MVHLQSTLGPVSFVAEWNGAIEHATFADDRDEPVRIRPSTWQVSLAYQFGWNLSAESIGAQGTYLSVSYSQSDDLAGVKQNAGTDEMLEFIRVGNVPKRRFLISAGEWVLDEDGEVSDDPQNAHALVAPGGPKGSGLGIVMDVLSGVLPFSLATVNRGEEFQGQRQASHFFQAIKIETFSAVTDFKREVDRTIRTIRSSRRKEGVDRIYVPGEIEWLKKTAWEKSGIPLHKTHVAGLEKAPT